MVIYFASFFTEFGRANYVTVFEVRQHFLW